MRALANDAAARRLSISDGATNNVVGIAFTNVANELKNRIRSRDATGPEVN